MRCGPAFLRAMLRQVGCQPPHVHVMVGVALEVCHACMCPSRICTRYDIRVTCAWPPVDALINVPEPEPHTLQLCVLRMHAASNENKLHRIEAKHTNSSA